VIPRSAIVAGVILLSLGLSLWQLSVPGYISFYDSGVYFAAAIHLVHGVLPYRDYTFVQPPGLLLLLSPLALLSRLVGTHDGFVMAEVLSTVVTALNVGLVASLVRHRGRIAMLVAGVGMALLPVSALVSTSVKLEPYCVCFILLGALAAYPGENSEGRLSNRALIVSGLLFGVAATIKLWAVFPFLALVLCLAPRLRRRIVTLVTAAAGAVLVLTLPFFVAAPRNFISQVLVEQVARRANGTDTMGIVTRLINMTGFAATSIGPTGTEAVIALSVMVVVVAVAFWRRLDDESVDLFLLLASLITVAALLTASASYNYYYYFTAPFLLGLLGVSAARLLNPAQELFAKVPISLVIRRWSSWLTAVAGVVLVIALLLYDTSFYTFYMSLWGEHTNDVTPIASQLPPNSCTVYLDVTAGILANRLQSSNPECPSVVDPYGMWMAWGYELIPPAPAFVAEWQSYFAHAQYAVMNSSFQGQSITPGAPTSSSIPWTNNLKAWFAHNYHLVYRTSGLYIYANDSKS
jgi:hypothetical protein